MLGGKSLKTVLLGLVLAGGCLLLLAAAAACGGSNGGDKSPPSPTTSGSPAPTTEPVPTIAPVPTIDANVPLVEYHSDLGYSVGYPQGWEPPAATSSPVAYFSWSLAGRPIAQLAVLCNRGANQTVESLMAQDAAILPQGGGVMPTTFTPVELAGLPGREVKYTTGFSGLTIEQVAVYAVSGDCGWRIGLATYGGAGSLDLYLPLFDRILASFQLG